MRWVLWLVGLVALVTPARADEAAAAVRYLPADTVQAAFAKGQPLVETGSYKIHASRRDQAGQAEIHVADTDIIYVLDGAATFVTGGRVVDGRTVAPGEVRGAAIQDGDTRRLSKGDVVVVPAGVSHWFQAVEPPLLYYVVKVTAPEEAGR